MGELDVTHVLPKNTAHAHGVFKFLCVFYPATKDMAELSLSAEVTGVPVRAKRQQKLCLKLRAAGAEWETSAEAVPP